MEVVFFKEERMAQARVDYGKVAAPRPFGGTQLVTNRLDVFRFLMICMVLLTVVSVFHVWSRFKLVDLNLQISETSRLLKEAEQEQKRLNLEMASLRTPARIETIARNELGMALPSEQQVVLVK
jgi:cell division protein FtsL